MRQDLLGNHRPARESIDGILQMARRQPGGGWLLDVNFLSFFFLRKGGRGEGSGPISWVTMPSVTVYGLSAACCIASAVGFAPTGASSLSLRGPVGAQAACARRQPRIALKMSDRKADIEEVMKELTEFREKIVDQSKSLAKKVKAKPKDLAKALEEHPDIIQIDAAMAELEKELKTL